MEKIMRMKSYLPITLLLTLFLFSGCTTITTQKKDPSQAEAIAKPENILPAPWVQFDPDGKFSFIAFGDTRNSDLLKESSCSSSSSSSDTTTSSGSNSEKSDSDDEPKTCLCDEIDHGVKNKFGDYRLHLIRRVANSLKGELSPLQSPKNSFALFTGDMIYCGGHGPYWGQIRDIFDQNLRGQERCPAKLYSVLGNHELWGQGALKEFLETYPCQSQQDLLSRYFAFYAGQSAFISLDSGGYGKDKEKFANDDTKWSIDIPFKDQEEWLKQVIDYGVQKKGVKNVFVQYHKPSFSHFKHPPLSDKNDPVVTLELMKKKGKYSGLNFYVFNGHNHTTEFYKTPGGIFVLVAGGGGAPQPPNCVGKMHLLGLSQTDALSKECKHKNNRKNYDHKKGTLRTLIPPPEERFWKSLNRSLNERVGRINYFQVVVNGGKVTMQEICLTETKDGKELFEQGVFIDQKGNITAPTDTSRCQRYRLKEI
jgi:hypothetical protein